ncbi:hypothetical protein HYH02_007054 [Chlamydomonas schloesseri]|uniref:Acyl-[acyl-carrier-protein] desaturase n=1 Tax=Chlamydomonas schloesseri TaxID=2026947 RepID=A0A836B5A9_9CHLO|nr:hypothetical protein HYH02_007054 [Chlamydomonas schloesseri]|eukprot:KAG2448027.1 hypothetical protein HYH02_007054 [Chlamydomonas schloesseri]
MRQAVKGASAHRRPAGPAGLCPTVLATPHAPIHATRAHAGRSPEPSSSSQSSSGASPSSPSSAPMSPIAARILSGASAGPAPRPSSSGLVLPPSARATAAAAAAAAAPAATATSAPSSLASSHAATPASHAVNGSAAAVNASGAPVASGGFRHGLDGPIFWLDRQRVHSLSDYGRDVMRSMSGWAASELPKYLKDTGKHWQPSDLLPDSASPDFLDQVHALRTAAGNLPNEYLVVLVGDMITEEALPSYMNMLNTLDEVRDETGAADTPWASWTREWTAEENRHGDLLNKYLYLTGRVDMRAIEGTIQRLIGSGLDPKLENNPYLCFVYTSFQERATRISHGNTARLATYHGDAALGKLCGLVAGDEARHEQAYSAIVSEILRRDPDGAVLAFADMMKKGIVMPAHFVDDGWHSAANADPGNGKPANLFGDYAAVADSIGVYTTHDYANIVDVLVKRWDIEHVAVRSGEAAEAQAFLMKHSERIRRLADITTERRLRDRKRGKNKSAAFSWIFKREVSLM